MSKKQLFYNMLMFKNTDNNKTDMAHAQRLRFYTGVHVKPATCWLIYIFEENESCGTL
jgi:hypothetical protein